MLNLLLTVLILFSVGTTYYFWIRPILLAQPSFREFYDHEESFWSACRLKMQGLKQRLLVAVTLIAGFVLEAYDFIAPLIGQAGVDVQQLAPMIPPKLWPLITMGLMMLVAFFRHLADKRASMALAEAEAENGINVKPPTVPKIGGGG